MTHALKTTLEYFNKIQQQKKNFELRKMDRPFKVDDKMLLQEFDGVQYTGNEIELIITDVFSGSDAEKFGLKKGFGIISFNDIKTVSTQLKLPLDVAELNGKTDIINTIPPPQF